MITASDEVEALRMVCAAQGQRAYVANVTRATASAVFIHNAIARRLRDRALVTVDGSIVEPTDAGRAEAAR